MTGDEFAATEIGRALEMYFLDGEGREDNTIYVTAQGFSIVSDSLVVGYRSGRVHATFQFDGGKVTGWRGCAAQLVKGGLVAHRWRPVRPIDTGSTAIAIEVWGGGCVTLEGGGEMLAEVDSAEVVEHSESAQIVVWVRERPWQGYCADFGRFMPAEAELTTPLSDRRLIDAGTIPATAIGPYQPVRRAS